MIEVIGGKKMGKENYNLIGNNFKIGQTVVSIEGSDRIGRIESIRTNLENSIEYFVNWNDGISQWTKQGQISNYK